MALQNTDNFLVSRSGSSHKLAWSDLQTDISGSLSINEAFTTTGDPVTSVQSIVPYSAAYGIQLPVAGVNDYNISGALRYNSVAAKVELYDGNDWIIASGNTSFSSAPPSPASEGDIWYDVDDGRAYVYYNDGDSSQWVEMNPSWNGGIPPEAITPDKMSAGGIQWDTSGNHNITGSFGIGTTSPASDLHIARTSSATADFRIQDNTGYAEIANSSGNLYITADRGNVGSKDMIFRVGGTSEKARITSGGNVGIGTTNPTEGLTINNAIQPKLGLSINDTTSLRIQAAGVGAFIDYPNTFLAFRGGANGTTDQVIIKNDGKVGIGTTSPNSLFEITASSPVLTIRSTDTSLTTADATLRLAESGAGGSVDNYWDLVADQTVNNFGFSIKEGANTRLAIEASTGNVGIGSNSPLCRLDVGRLGSAWTGDTTPASASAIFHNGDNAASSPSTIVLAGGSSSYSGVFFGDEVDCDRGQIRYYNDSNSLRYSDDGTDHFTVTSTGYVGIGPSTATAPLDVYHNNATMVRLKRKAIGENSAIEFTDDEDTPIYVGKDPNHNFVVGLAENLATQNLLKVERGGNQQIVVGGTTAVTSVNYSIITSGGLQSGASYTSTTASSANVHIQSSGLFVRSTSSARFKTNVETMDDSYADAILEARPIWYNSIASEDTAHPEWGYWGFIAEELAEVDPRLVHFAEDAKGNLIADGVQYERFVPHLVNLAKRQKLAIEELTSQVEALGGSGAVEDTELKTKVSVLEVKNSELRNKVALLEEKLQRVWDRLGL